MTPQLALTIARTGLWAIAAIDVVIAVCFAMAGSESRNWLVLSGVYGSLAVSQALMAFIDK